MALGLQVPRQIRDYIVAALAGLIATPAWGQTAAVVDAEDAFGQRVGDEAIGLYSEAQVRGFSLENAGNYRLDGHYFVRSGQLPDGLSERSTVRVGASALYLDFPAPSGLVDLTLRRPGESAMGGDGTVGLRWASSLFLRAHAWARIGDGTSIVGGVESSPDATFPDGTRGSESSFGLIAEQELGRLSVRGIVGGARRKYNGDYGFFTSAPRLPPVIAGRYEMFGPDWGQFERTERILGALASWKPSSHLDVSAAYFHNRSETPKADFTALDLIAPDRAQATIFMARDQWNSVASGELKVSYEVQTGAVSHRLTAAFRRNDSLSRNTSGEAFNLNEVDLRERAFPAAVTPTGNATYLLTDLNQTSIGLSYQGRLWRKVSLRLGAQRIDYDKTVDTGVDLQASKERPWLYNASVAFQLSAGWQVYGSYVRGLEEAGLAPNSAVNRNEVLPAIIAQQVEFGLRADLKGMTLAGAVFEISKPTTGFDQAGRFGLIGEVRHRGVEVSIAGNPFAGLSIAAGLVALQPTLSGPSVTAGLASEHPLGVARTVAQASASYDFRAIPGLSADATITYTASVPADQLDSFRIPARTTLDLGARYEFTAAGLTHALRLRVQDVAGSIGWQVFPGGALARTVPRAASLQLTSSF